MHKRNILIPQIDGEWWPIAGKKSLKEVGNALEMKFVYGFVPVDGSIDSLLDRKSRILAEKIILRTNHNMMLEDQAIEKGKLETAIDDLSKEIKLELKKIIWD